MPLDQVRTSTVLIVRVFDARESRNVSVEVAWVGWGWGGGGGGCGVKTVQISFYCHRRAQVRRQEPRKGVWVT